MIRAPRLTLLAQLSLGLLLGCAGDPDAGSSSLPPGSAPGSDDVRHLVPVPERVAFREGPATAWTDEIRVDLGPADPVVTRTVLRFLNDVENETGISTETARAHLEIPPPEGATVLRVDVGTTSSGVFPSGVAREPEWEAYTLSIREDGVLVSAPGRAGAQYALETLRQLIVQGSDGTQALLPRGRIDDQPRFTYRGMHLDVGRHFFPPKDIKTYLDLLARYKFNRFHWPLTEDQGWRIEIQRYPALTEISSLRRETILEKNFDPYVGDGIPHAGFYTQDEVRDIVAYAAARNIEVIPEIELPGHSRAALAAFPELACTEGPFEVSTIWGVHDDIYCPREETFEFLENVLTEVLDLFPSELIHVGGDEAPKKRWEESDVAQAVIRREGLADEDELQSWFIRRIETFLLSKGRRLIGWDEILEGGLAPQATVMSWRGMEGGIEAARMGHDVVMTPNT